MMWRMAMIIVVTAIVEYYDSVNDSYNVLGNGTYGGELSDGDITNMLWTPEFYDGTFFGGGEPPFLPPADDGGDSGEPPVDDGGVAGGGLSTGQVGFANLVANAEANTVSMDVVLPEGSGVWKPFILILKVSPLMELTR